MNELIKITTDSKGTKLVSARELHEFLGSKERFSKWFDKMIGFGFEENTDYTPYQTVHPQNKQDIIDYVLTIDTAKEISMVSKLPKGKEARKYFIECERKLNENTPKIPTTYKEALLQLIEAEEAKEQLLLENAQKSQQINEMQPKSDYYDEILKSTDTISITQISKDYGISGQAMNQLLFKEKVQYKQSRQWLLYAKHQNCGYTKSETISYSTGYGNTKTKLNTKWTQKGRLFIHELMKKNGVIALIDKENN